MNPKIILASQSPRRAEILSQIKVPFSVVPSSFDEDSFPYDQNPESYVRELAENKAEVVSKAHPESIVIAADTVVFLEKRHFNKPSSFEEAVEFHRQLRGRWHSVWSGISIRQGKKHFSAAEETHVLFNALSDEQIKTYLNSITWHDKSGGYAIQGNGGALLVAQIKGCFYNVMGLPVNALQKLLTHFGIDLWQFLAKH